MVEREHQQVEHTELRALENSLSCQRNAEAKEKNAEQGIGAKAVHDGNAEANRMAREGAELREMFRLEIMVMYAQRALCV